MNNKQIKEVIEEGFNRLYPLTYISWTDYRAEMFDYERKMQREHRKSGAAVGMQPHKFSDAIVAKYFVIRAIRSALFEDRNFRPSDILHCTKSYLLAHAIEDDSRYDLQEMFIGYSWYWFNQIDYSGGDLVFVSNEEAA